MSAKYHSLAELIKMIDEPNRSCCQKMYEENKDSFDQAPGSSHNHQAWSGGYIDHITEGMNISVVLYSALNQQRPLPYSQSDVLLAFFLHDLEKPWRYINDGPGNFKTNPALKDKEKQAGPFKIEKIKEYNFQLTEEHWNAIKYAEGEHADYTPGKRGMGPLAALVHMCDIMSARGWFDHPAITDDPWTGAKRSKTR